MFSRQGTLVDCAASDNGGSENGHSPRSQQSHHGAHASGTFGGASGAQQSSGSSNNNTAAAAGGEGGGGVSANMQKHLGELDAVSCSPDDDDHTILQEILSTHQMQVLNTANAGKTGKSKRARSDISCTAAASSAEAGPSSGLLDHFLGMPLQGVPHVANHIFATQHGDRTAQVSAGAAEVPELQMLSLNHQSHQQRSNSVMSMLTTDGTDASDIASSPAATTPQGITTVVAKAAEVPMSTSANMECEQTPAALHYPPAPAVAVRSDSFHSLSMSSAAIVGSPVRATAALVPASRLPSGDHRHYPAIQGLPQSVLRSMSGSAFNSPAGSREVPPFIPSGMKSAPQNVTTSVTQSVRRIGVPGRSPAASPSATDLRRSYYSALENHFAAESAAGAMEISMTETTTGTCADPARDEAFSSPMRQPVPCGSAFTPPFANSAFQQTVGKSASSTGTTTEEALSVATDESLAHNAVTLLPIVTATDEGAGCNKSSPRGGTPKRVSFTHSKAADSPISCFELLYSHKYAPAGIHPDSAPTSGSGSSAGECPMLNANK